MPMQFWDLGRASGPERKTERWALVTGILLALVAVYAMVTSSTWAYSVLFVAGLILFIVMMYPDVQNALEHEEARPRMHQTLDPPPFGLSSRYRWLVAALLFAVFLAFELLRH